MAMWSVEENQVVIWQSPGKEELEAGSCEASEAGADGEGASEKAKSESVEASPANVSASVKVLEPSDLEQDSEQARVVAALRKELSTPAGDPQVLATRIRK